MSTRLTLAIQEHFEKLSPSERRLATLLVDRADDLLAYSASEMAAMAGVSKATAARLFRSLGYADFNEVKLQARQERNLAPPFQREPSALAAPARGAPSVTQHLHAEVDSLTRTFETLRGDTLREAAALVAGAPRVWLLGLGLDLGLAHLLQPQLSRVRPEVFLLAPPGGLWAEALVSTSARDCLLLIQTQPRMPLLDTVVTHAAATRMPIVAVVDIRNVAWARRSAQSVLPVIGASAEHAYSAMAGASMLHLLVQHVADRLGERARQRQVGVHAIRREMDEGS